MRNEISKTIPALVALGTKAKAGLTQYAAGLTLPHTTAADLPAGLETLVEANAAYKETLVTMKKKRLAQETAVKEGRRFMMVVRENLKPVIGVDYSEQWTPVGFAGSLAVPENADGLLNALLLAKAYLTAHPIPDGGPSLAAARATLLQSNLANAVAGVTLQKDAVSQAMELRIQSGKAFELGLRTLLRELHQVLDPMDARWLAFGFNKPGQLQAPIAPELLEVSALGQNRFSAKWKRAARASHYRIWLKVVGVDEEFQSAGSPSDLAFILENLPASAQIEVAISAVNNGGESVRSESKMIQTVAL